MASTQKACKQCKFIFEGNKCPECGSEEFKNTFKGKVVIMDAEKSEIAKNMKISKRGEFAIKI